MTVFYFVRILKILCNCDILIKYKYLSGKLIFHMIYGMINEYVCA